MQPYASYEGTVFLVQKEITSFQVLRSHETTTTISFCNTTTNFFQMSETDSSIDFDEEEDQSEQEDREVFSDLSDQEEDEDEQPVELQNTKTEIFGTKEAKRRRKRNRKSSMAPDDDVLNKAKEDRLKREKLHENDNLLLVTEFSESDSDNNDEISEVQNSKQVIIKKLKTTETVNKTSENAFRFAQSALNGGSRFHRISLSSFRSKKKKGPALEFSSKKNKTNV